MTEIKHYIDILKDSPDEVQKIIIRVIQLENEKLHHKSPRITEDIILIVKEEVK